MAKETVPHFHYVQDSGLLCNTMEKKVLRCLEPIVEQNAHKGICIGMLTQGIIVCWGSVDGICLHKYKGNLIQMWFQAA